MQSLDVISVNLWQLLVSLLNLVLIFVIVKFLLYKPVKKMLMNRQNAIEEDYNRAEEAKNQALIEKQQYEEKLSGAKKEADGVIRSAVKIAKARENEIIENAKSEAEGIVNRAKEEALLEKKKAENEVKKEIIEVGALLSEKMLKREIKKEDHKEMIDSFIEEIGEDNDADS